MTPELLEALELVREGCELDPLGMPLPPCPPPMTLALLMERRLIRHHNGKLVLTAAGMRELGEPDPEELAGT